MYQKYLAMVDKYRLFPKFQLERHVDTIFGIYLPEILDTHFKEKNNFSSAAIIPEFPISKKILLDEYSKDDARSIDFLVLSDNDDEAIFVEIKTDMRSRNDKQEGDYSKLLNVKFDEVVKKLIKTIQSSKYKTKYVMLINELHKYNIIHIDRQFFKTFIDSGKIFTKYINEIRVVENNRICKMLYIMPIQDDNSKNDCIPFDEIIHNRKIDPDFRKYLEIWKYGVSKTVRDRIAEFYRE